MTTTALPPNVVELLDRVTDRRSDLINEITIALNDAAVYLVDKEDLGQLTKEHKAELGLAYDAVCAAEEALTELARLIR